MIPILIFRMQSRELHIYIQHVNELFHCLKHKTQKIKDYLHVSPCKRQQVCRQSTEMRRVLLFPTSI